MLQCIDVDDIAITGLKEETRHRQQESIDRSTPVLSKT